MSGPRDKGKGKAPQYDPPSPSNDTLDSPPRTPPPNSSKHHGKYKTAKKDDTLESAPRTPPPNSSKHPGKYKTARKNNTLESAPRTPPPHSSKHPGKYKTERKEQQARPSLRDTFPDGMNVSTDTASTHNESGDERDPHDLTLSPKHTARTSIVDNMLLSLDQFSSNTSVLEDYRLFNSVLEQQDSNNNSINTNIINNNPRDSQDSASQDRPRGLTFSSTLSSETDPAYEEGISHYGIQTAAGPVGRRSTSSSNYNRTSSLRGTGSLRGYDGFHTRAQPPGSRAHRTRKGSKGSVTSGLRTRPDSGEETSLDYDRAKTTPFPPFPEDNETPGYDEDEFDAAPTPSVPAGPRKYPPPSQSDFPSTLNPQSLRSPVASRRSSVKSSSRSNPASKKKNLPNNTGPPTLRIPDSAMRLEPPPGLGGDNSLDPPAPSPTISFNKPSFPPPADPPPPKERPGFFRRVFGSSKNSAPPPDDASFMSQDRDSMKAPIPPPKNDAPATNPPPRQVVNKKSSFFRRRKKSVVDSVPPPIALPQHLAPKRVDPIKAPEPSPVSSLRQVMNPYLADAIAASSERPSKEPQEPSVDDAESTKSASQKKRGSFLPPAGGSKSKYNLYSSVTSSGPETSSLPNSSGDDASTSKSVDFGGGGSPVRDSLAIPSPSRLAPPPTISVLPISLSPVVEDFPHKTAASAEVPDTPKTPKLITPGAESEMSNYFTACNTPTMPSEEPKSAEEPTSEEPKPDEAKPEAPQSEEPKYAEEPTEDKAEEGPKDVQENGPTAADREQAQKLFDNQDEVIGKDPAGAWLGDPDRAAIRVAYMDLFDWSNMNILAAFRSLCGRLVLKGETQQVDRVLDAFSSRWCQCNPNHGFKASDVVHTICYSLLLLNTDLHLADIDQKMTKPQFVRNTLPTIHRVAADAAPSDFEAAEPPAKLSNRLSRVDLSGKMTTAEFEGDTGRLVSTPFHGTIRAWEQQVEAVLKEFYSSIQKERLPLHGAESGRETPQASSNNLLGTNQNPSLRRSPSTVSKSGSDIFPRGRSADSRYGAARWSSKPRSRARLYPPSAMGSSRTSLDDQSSLWSPSASSTWSKYSLGKLTSASVDSFGSDRPRGDYQQSIGFANALSQAIIREDSANSIASSEDPERTTPFLEDETLQLAGAPWAKEGSLKHKHHLDSVDKRAKDRNWNESFAVIQQGWMRLFSFNPATKSIRQQKAKQRQGGSVVVGGGNWMANAEEVWKFLLRQTIASALPPPGYSKSRPHVWALSLPTGAVHLFQVGTPEIVREFVSSANYWSARLSKQPLVGGISNIEYGWSDAVINSALIHADNNPANNSNHNHNHNHSNSKTPPPSSYGGRTSIQSSIRSSVDQQGMRPKLPADRVNISDWAPPQQSMAASSLTEEDQLTALQEYIKKTEDEFQRHNERRPAMILAFSPRHPNASKAMSNFERKSSYLLREIVKFRTYIDSLNAALEQKKQIYGSNEENNDLVSTQDANPSDGPQRVPTETPQPA